MSGWIKWEKDLETDPRTLRMAKELKRICNAPAFNHVTLLCGCLIRLWSYADSHIREDDTLDLGCTEIDELLGIPNFCSIMPNDWLVELDEHTVELPGFQAHNGVEAKKQALTQKRVSNHRQRKRNAEVEKCNAGALPDQTRPDQTKPDKTKEEREPRAPRSANASRLPADFALTPERRAIAETEKADPEREFASFTDYWRAASGANARKHDWDATWRNWCRRAADFKPRINGSAASEPKLTWRPPPDEDDRDVPN